MHQELIELLKKDSPITLKEIQEKLKLTSSEDIRNMMNELNELIELKEIYTEHHQYYYIDSENYFIGRVKDVSKFELAIINPDGKIYVEKKNANDAFDKDEVLVKKSKKGNEIVHVFKRGIENITGTFFKDKEGWRFRSDVDLHTTFKVVNQKEFSLSNNVKAVVQIVKYGRPLEVKIVRLIGPANQAGVDVTAILYENNIRQEFPDEVIQEVENVPSTVQKSDLEGRTDYRDLYTVTIDGDDSKDFDDAISIERTKDGYRLYVHIADVSNYVKENAPLDQEAYKRGTSVYVVDRCVPMLPFELSNGICSLNPDVDRLTLTCAMDINKEGVVTDYTITPSIIHSDKRCTYAKVNAVLDGDEETIKEYGEAVPMLQLFEELAKKLKAQTDKRGAINFATKEPKIVLNKKGKPVDIFVKERGFAEQMIEEAMILANVCVANFLNSQKYPGVYRVHENPDPEKVESLSQMAKIFHVPFEADLSHVNAKEIEHFLSTIDDQSVRDVLSLVALRSMAKARYDAKNIGHFGSSLDEYCHFTSPIRRYSDLIVHRMLRRYAFDHEQSKKVLEKDRLKTQKQAVHISEKERDAINAERFVNDYKMAQYMEKRVGEQFKGTIISVMNFGFFVELDNTIEGLVPLHTLMDDYYKYDEGTMSLVGETNGKKFQIGDTIDVICTDVDVPKGQVTFGILQNSTRKAKEPLQFPKEKDRKSKAVN